MRGSLLLTLGFAFGASASAIRRGLAPVGTFKTHNFTRVAPEDAAAKLNALEQSNPGAVQRPGAPQQTDSPVTPAAKTPTGFHSDFFTPNVDAAGPIAECANPAVHYEWDNLTPAHRSQFVASAKCLFNRPSNGNFPGATNRWEDMVVVHQQMSNIIHNVGQFLPYHRYFLWIFEQLMRNECGYTGPMTWWDETKNAGNFNGASLATTQYFGHLPDGNVVCISSGVFAYTTCHIGPGGSDTSHCLSRGVNEQLSAAISTNYVNTCNSYTAYTDMQSCSFFGPHAYGHDAVGGVMSDVQASPSDPLFFMHHGFIDRNWRIWQRTNPTARTYAIGGYTTQTEPPGGWVDTTLDYVLSSMGLEQSVTINEVMDTQGSFLCYHYDY